MGVEKRNVKMLADYLTVGSQQKKPQLFVFPNIPAYFLRKGSYIKLLTFK